MSNIDKFIEIIFTKIDRKIYLVLELRSNYLNRIVFIPYVYISKQL